MGAKADEFVGNTTTADVIGQRQIHKRCGRSDGCSRIDEHEVGFGLSDRNSGDGGQSIGKAGGSPVVLDQPIHVFKGDMPGGGDDTGLTHAATDGVSMAARPGDGVGIPGKHGPDRGPETLRQVEHDGIYGFSIRLERDVAGHGSVPQAGTVEMDR